MATNPGDLPLTLLPPASIPLSGTELLYVVQGGKDKSTPVGTIQGANVLPLGSRSLSLRDLFDDVVINAPLVANYQFGTGAVGDGITTFPITNLTDLAAHFNAFEDFTEGVTINSEIQRYEDFNASNHQFLTDRLNLVGVNPNSDWNDLVTQTAGTVNLNNTPSSIAALGLSAGQAATLQVGQMATYQGHGTYVITAISPGVSVTLQELGGSSTTANAAPLLMFWKPVQSAILTAFYPVNSGATLVFGSLPTGILGFQMAHYNGNIVIERNQDYRVAGVTLTTVTLNTPWTFDNLNIGDRIWFLPVVTSGQIWTQEHFDITNPQSFWGYSTAFGIVSRTDGVHDFTGDHKWQLIFANGKTYRYFDGVLFNVKMFNWGGQAPLQIACNLACGSLEAAYGSNTLSPNNSNNFTGMVLGVKSIKVWYQEAP